MGEILVEEYVEEQRDFVIEGISDTVTCISWDFL